MSRASRFRKRTPAEAGDRRHYGSGGKDVRLMVRVAMGPDGSLGPGKIRLVELIDRHGSISAACREMGMSYRRAWLLLKSLNSAFRDPVVETQQGGNKGGGARLTPFGRVLLDRYRAIQTKASAAVAAELAALEKDFVRWAPKAPKDK